MTPISLRTDRDDPPIDSLRGRAHQKPLDGLRGIAILAVMLFHFSMYEHAKSVAGKVVLRLFSVGWAGVDLFFTLSGFLITGILLETKRSPRFFRTFYARRALRIFPLYYAVLGTSMLAILFTFGVRGAPARELFHRQLWLWGYGANIEDALAGTWVFNTNHLWLNHFWSLAIEEQFYLCWPLLVFLLGRRSLAWLSAAIVVLSPLVRAAFVARGAPALTVYSLTICRLDPIALGSLAAVVIRDSRLLWKTLRWLPLAMGACVLELVVVAGTRHGLSWVDPVVHMVAFSPLAILSAAVVLWVSVAPSGRWSRLLSNPVLCWFGKYSYGLYILHYLLWPFLSVACSQSTLARWTHSEDLGAVGFVAVGIAASTLLALLSYHGFERHFMALKRYFPQAMSRSLESTSL